MVLGLAMCASFAFAQTNSVAQRGIKGEQLKALAGAPVETTVDYKASIFAKDGDTIQVWDFSSMTGFVYQSNGRVLATDQIDDTVVGASAHSIFTDYSVWQRIEDSAYVYSEAMGQTYPSFASASDQWWLRRYLGLYMGAYNSGSDNGFAFIFPYDVNRGQGLVNAYMQFPAVATPANAGIIDVAFIQFYRKYYDQCYIDYKIGNSWRAREINVTGVDIEVNDLGAYRVTYTMPMALANESNIEIRFRLFGGNRGSVAGYCWAVDNVTLIALPDGTSRMNAYTEYYVDGGYGTIPQGFNIPMSWMSQITNTGSEDLTNFNITMSHLYFDEAGTLHTDNILTAPQGTVAAGDPTATTGVYVDERGFLGNDDLRNYVGWYGFAPTYGATTLPSSYGAHGLPTTHGGYNYVTTTATVGSFVQEWDTILYRVSTADEEFDENSDMISGYRWGRDNGIIPSGSQWSFMYTDNGYVTEDPDPVNGSDHWSKANYMVLNRYVTGDVIPEGWRILGMEIIPATTSDVISNAAGAQFTAELYYDSYTEDGESMSFNTVNTGINNVVQEVSYDQLNMLESGYILPGQEYNAVNIMFPEQPELLPNTAYRVGYSLTRDGSFAPASTAYGYYDESGNYVRYYNNNSTAPFYSQFIVGDYYATRIFDPLPPEGSSGSLWSSMYYEQWPMIRLIVGPYQDLPSTTVYAICGDPDTGYMIQNVADENVCGEAVNAVIGSSPIFYILPTSDHMVIDSIYIDGVKVTPYDETDPNSDENCFEGDYNVTDADGNILLYRKYYGYQFANIQDAANGHSIKAFTSYNEFINGIDPVASNVSLGLSPNPATSQVKLNIKGVTGMVNCNIIDMSGRVIYNANINAEEAHTISLNNVPAGAYFVRVTNDSFSKVEKLIVR